MKKLDDKRQKQIECIIEKFVVEENGTDAKTLVKALRMIDDENVLYRIVKASDKILIGSDVVKRINSEELLEKIAFDSKIDGIVRITAVKRIKNQDVLKRIYESSGEAIRKVAISLITDESFLYEIVFNEKEQHISVAAVKRIATQDKLYNIAVRHQVIEVQIAAVMHLDEQKWLAKIAKLTSLNAKIREEAIRKLDPHNLETLLLDIAKNDSDIVCRIRAIKCLITPKFLIDIALDDSNVDVQYVAISTIPEISMFSEVNKGLMTIIKGTFDYNVKAMAIEKISVSSDEFFIEHIKKEKNEEVRLAAVKRINNQTALANIAYYEVTKYQYQSIVRMEALKRLGALDVINMIALSDRNPEIRKLALERAYPATLVSVASNDEEMEVSMVAVEKLENEYDLVEALLYSKNRWVQNAIITKLCSNMKK